MQSYSPELPGGNIDVDMILKDMPVDNRATKIFCTLGPACWEVDQLVTLINAGLNVARFNFSHGDHAGHKACLDRLREAAAKCGKPVGKKNSHDLSNWLLVVERMKTDVCVFFVANLFCESSGLFCLSKLQAT